MIHKPLPPPPHTHTHTQEGGERGGWGYIHSGREEEEEHKLPKTMVYNIRYDEARWKGICNKEGPMHDIIKRTNALGLDPPLPPRNAQKEA